MRGLDLRHLAPGRELRRRHVLPALAAVAGDLDQAVVGAGPERVRGLERRSEGVDRAALLGRRGILVGELAQARRDARALARQVGADGAPGGAAVAGLEDHVGGEVEHVRVGRREDDRLRAVDPVGVAEHRDRRHVLRLVGGPPVLGHHVAAGAVDDVRVERVGCDVAVLDGAHRVPVAEGDRAVVAAAGDAHRAALLLAAADLVGELVARLDVVELRGRLVVPGAPGAAAVGADHRALVGGEQDDVRVVRVDPDVLVVVAARRAAQAGPGLAAVLRAHGDDGGAVDDVRVLRVDGHHRQIAAADPHQRPWVVGDALPGGAGVVRAVEPLPLARLVAAAGRRRQQRVDAVGPARRDRQVGLHDLVGEAAGELAPVVAAVGRLEDAAVAAAIVVVVLPRPLAALPEGRVDDLRVGRIDVDVVGAGVLVEEEHLLPALAAVGRAEDAALGIGAVGVSEHRGEDAVGVARVDGERRDLLPLLEAEVLPGLAAVGRLVDAVADREIGALQPLARADVERLRRRGSDRDGADRLRRLAVEDRLPGSAVVVRAPDAAVADADIEDAGVTRRPGEGAGATAAEGADVAPVHLLVERGRHRLGGRGGGEKGRCGDGRESEEREDGRRRAAHESVLLQDGSSKCRRTAAVPFCLLGRRSASGRRVGLAAPDVARLG